MCLLVLMQVYFSCQQLAQNQEGLQFVLAGRINDRFIAKLHLKFCFHEHRVTGTGRNPCWFAACSWAFWPVHRFPPPAPPQRSPTTPQQPQLPLGLLVLLPWYPLPSLSPGQQGPLAPSAHCSHSRALRAHSGMREAAKLVLCSG